MTQDLNDTELSFDALPEVIPIFPLTGVLLLPGGQLPLNVFEEKYLAMVEDALKNSRMIGMIQPQENATQNKGHGRPVFQIGCAGKITAFSETADGRYEVVLTGTARFSVQEEIERQNGYRRVRADWSPFDYDLKQQTTCLNINRDRLYTLLSDFFDLHEISCSWESVKAVPDSKLITALSMICPLDPNEKQGLLEARDCAQRAEMFMTMLELAIHSDANGSPGDQHH